MRIRQRPHISTPWVFLAACLLLTPKKKDLSCFLSSGCAYAFVPLSPSDNYDARSAASKRWRTSLSSTWTTKEQQQTNVNKANVTLSIGRPVLSTRTKQQRRKSRRPRRPKEYWSDIYNVEVELWRFWDDANVLLSETRPPPIPNESLLNHFERHDIRWAIARHGGRKAVSYRLDGARIIPGKWAEAVEGSAEVQALLDPSNPAGTGLSPDLPPLSPQERKRIYASASDIREDINTEIELSSLERSDRTKRWQHQPGRKPKGYWNKKVVIWELHEYLKDYKRRRQRPSVWMPRLCELTAEGKDDLKGAITRYGGARKICEFAGLVPYAEWNYFEMQFELVLSLQEYMAKHRNGDGKMFFPRPSDIQRDGYESLYYLIQQFGGRKFVASKLGMKIYAASGSARRKSDADFMDMNFGPFSLDFAVRLLSFVREEMMLKTALSLPVIQMPTRAELIKSGEHRLAKEIEEFGGYENVGRRLGLAIFEQPRQINRK